MALCEPDIVILPEPGLFEGLFPEFAVAQDTSAPAALVLDPERGENIHQIDGIYVDFQDALACRANGDPTSA